MAHTNGEHPALVRGESGRPGKGPTPCGAALQIYKALMMTKSARAAGAADRI